MTDFSTAILNPELGVRFYLKIRGVGDIFLDGSIPVGPDDVAWAAPTSKTHSYTLREHMLDTTGGVIDNGHKLSRRTGELSPSTMRIVLQEDRAATLFDLMAREKASGAAANLEADVAYDNPLGSGSVLSVDSTTGWDASGFLWMGGEAIYYPLINGNDFGQSPGDKCTRDIFNLEDGGGDSYGDKKYRFYDAVPGAPRVVTDYKRVWHNTWVSLRAFVVDQDGRAYDSAFGGDYSREVWRGVVKGNPRPLKDWERWELRCVAIDSILQTEIGREPILGTLIKYPGGYKANAAGQKDPNDAPPAEMYAYYLDEGTRHVSLTVKEYTVAADYPDLTNDVKAYVGEDRIALQAVGLITKQGLKLLFNQAIQSQFDTDAKFDALALFLGTYPNGYMLNATSADTKVYEVTFHWNEPGSVGKLMGFEGDNTLYITNGGVEKIASGVQISAYIGPDSLKIPFFYPDAAGLLPDDAPSSGFARIGGEEGEIVQYDSVTDASSDTAKGLYQLDIVKRGAMGTTPIEHTVTIGNDFTSDAATVMIEFGTGFDGISPIHALMHLAVSTGLGHHGQFDDTDVGDKVAVPLNPLHFDQDRIGSMSDALVGQQAEIQFFTTKTHKLSELAARWLQPFGMYVVARPNGDGDFLITIDEVLPPLESGANTDVGASELDFSDPGMHIDSIDRIVNQMEVYPSWDNLKEEQTEDRFTVTDQDSCDEFGEKGKITWKLIGYGFDPLTFLPTVKSWARQVMRRFSRPYDMFRLKMDRSGWLLKPGDVIEVTLAQAPNASGVRGLTDEIAVVLQAKHTYQPRAGRSAGVGSEVLVVLEPHTRNSTYSPAAMVASATTGLPPTITLSDSEFIPDGRTAGEFFDDGDVVVILENEGDWSSTAERQLSNRSGNTFDLDSALGFAVTSGTIMIPAGYTTVQASQRKHVYVADNSTPPVLTGPGSTETFGYV